VAFLRHTRPAEYDRIVRERHERWDTAASLMIASGANVKTVQLS
jgi:hypothetical protein